MELVLLSVTAIAAYMSCAMFFAWLGGHSMGEFLDDRSGFDSDIAAWWFWYGIIIVIYPACVAGYCFVRGIAITVREAGWA